MGMLFVCFCFREGDMEGGGASVDRWIDGG